MLEFVLQTGLHVRHPRKQINYRVRQIQSWAESSVSDLGGGVDEFNIELFGLPGLGGGVDRLSEDERSLARSHNSSLDKDEIFFDLSVVREASHGGDVLLDSISLTSSVVGG